MIGNQQAQSVKMIKANLFARAVSLLAVDDLALVLISLLVPWCARRRLERQLFRKIATYAAIIKMMRRKFNPTKMATEYSHPGGNLAES